MTTDPRPHTAEITTGIPLSVTNVTGIVGLGTVGGPLVSAGALGRKNKRGFRTAGRP